MKTYKYCTFSRSQYNIRACTLKKERSLLGAAPNRQNLKVVIFSWASIFSSGSLCYLSDFGLPELDLLKSSGQSLFQKMSWISVHTTELHTLVQFRFSVANVRV